MTQKNNKGNNSGKNNNHNNKGSIGKNNKNHNGNGKNKVVRRKGMFKLTRRSRPEIIFDILEGIVAESESGKVSPTRVQHRSNISYDKLDRYIVEMVELGLLTDKKTLQVTAKGFEFRKDYAEVNQIIDQIVSKYL